MGQIISCDYDGKFESHAIEGMLNMKARMEPKSLNLWINKMLQVGKMSGKMRHLDFLLRFRMNCWGGKGFLVRMNNRKRSPS